MLLLVGCGAPENGGEERAVPKPPEPPAVPSTEGELADGCARDAEGQVACLNAAFELRQCDNAVVLGSMFQSNNTDETFTYRTAFGVDPTCLAELEKATDARGFRESDQRKFVATPRAGYRESLIFGLQISPDGSVVEWERTQE